MAGTVVTELIKAVPDDHEGCSTEALDDTDGALVLAAFLLGVQVGQKRGSALDANQEVPRGATKH